MFLWILEEILVFGFPVNWAPTLTKTVNLGWVPFESKYAILLDILLDTTSGQNFNKIEQYLGEYWSKPTPTPLENGSPFMDSEVMQKTLENFNFTITNARLIKLTTKKYLNKTFHLAKPWGITHRMYKGVNKNLAKSAIKSIF